jgi:ketosteroid isomerase-like protein
VPLIFSIFDHLHRLAHIFDFHCSELANPNYAESTVEGEEYIKVVRELYAALGLRDAETVERILAPDLDWWFHGPPCYQYLMRMLTGEPYSSHSFTFTPQSVTAVGNKVFVEGREDESQYWVHVWTLENGIITEVREYFNTTITVTDFNPSLLRQRQLCSPMWESSAVKSKEKSMPGLVLAI